MILGIIIAIAFLGACFCAAVFGISKRQDEQEHNIEATTDALCDHMEGVSHKFYRKSGRMVSWDRHAKLHATIDCATCGCMVKKELAVAGPDRIEQQYKWNYSAVAGPDRIGQQYKWNYSWTGLQPTEKNIVNDWYCRRCAPNPNKTADIQADIARLIKQSLDVVNATLDTAKKKSVVMKISKKGHAKKKA